MKVLIACEFSGIVRDAFEKLGHDAWSCDVLPTERKGKHIEDDVLNHLHENWDLMIAHPPCTHLAVSGARWFKDKKQEQKQALTFVTKLLNAPIKKIALENPISIISSHIRKPDQIIQPWQFGHGETKATCLWLKNLPKLKPTKIVDGRSPRTHFESPCPDRWKNRSRTLIGIADAMAEQWGGFMNDAKADTSEEQGRGFNELWAEEEKIFPKRRPYVVFEGQLHRISSLGPCNTDEWNKFKVIFENKNDTAIYRLELYRLEVKDKDG